MWLLAIFRIKNIGRKIKNTQHIYMKSALFSLKFSVKRLRVLAILRVKNIKIKAKNIWSIYPNSPFFSQKI
jgi:hypothetical protein